MQNAFSVVNRADEDELDLCEERELAFVPFFPLGSAFAGGPTQLAADPAIAEVAARAREPRPHRSRSRGCCTTHARILLIPGTSSVRHLEENIAAGEVALDDEDLQRLEDAVQLGEPTTAAEH